MACLIVAICGVHEGVDAVLAVSAVGLQVEVHRHVLALAPLHLLDALHSGTYRSAFKHSFGLGPLYRFPVQSLGGYETEDGNDIISADAHMSALPQQKESQPLKQGSVPLLQALAHRKDLIEERLAPHKLDSVLDGDPDVVRRHRVDLEGLHACSGAPSDMMACGL